MPKLRNTLALLVLSVGLSSCLSVATAIEITEGGSGTIELTFSLAEALTGLGPTDPMRLPLPIERDDFRRAVKSTPGLHLRSYRRTTADRNLLVSATISFDGIRALNDLYAPDSDVFDLRTEGEVTTLTQVISPGTEALPPRDAIAFYERELSGRTFTYEVRAPKPIRSTSDPGARIDGRRARVEYPALDLLNRRERRTWSVSW